MRRTWAAVATCALLALCGFAPAASASPFDPSGVIRLLPRPHARVAANESSNWFGYDQGLLQQGGTPFHSITAQWRVPRARQHKKHQAEDSATWIGIGGGCVDSGCAISDPTGLIQTGTEQDVSSSGRASYSAWWELVPVPSVTVRMVLKPGDLVYASVSELGALEMWRITLRNLTRHERFTTTTPYPSSQASAEWIEETPVAVGTGGAGVASLPNLNETPFDHATVNGKPADFKRSQQIQLYSGSDRIGTPSAPDKEHDGFGACAWAKKCPRPRS